MTDDIDFKLRPAEPTPPDEICSWGKRGSHLKF